MRLQGIVQTESEMDNDNTADVSQVAMWWLEEDKKQWPQKVNP